MTQLGPFLVLIGVVAVALAAVGGVVGWYNEESRRIRRGLRKVLKGETHALLVAHGRGRGAGFNFTSNTMAVAWDAGEWCLVYRLEELLGVELIIDGQVTGRAYRGEPRRPVDVLGAADKQVSVRLVFDDPRYPDFLLELWSPARAARRPTLNAAGAVEEGNRWLARVESVFRRQSAASAARAAAAHAPQPAPAAVAKAAELVPEFPSAPRSATAATTAPGGRQELPFDDEPPWDEDEVAGDKKALF
jgi:hypothetical protein